MAKKTTPPDDDDLSSLLGSLKQAKPKSKTTDYEVIRGHEKMVDEFITLQEKIKALQAQETLMKDELYTIGKQFNLKNKAMDTVLIAGTNENEMFVPTTKTTPIPVLDDDNNPHPVCERIKMLTGDDFVRWFIVNSTIAVDMNGDPDRLRKMLKHCIDGGFGDLLISKQQRCANDVYHREKYKLKLAVLEEIESIVKPVAQLKKQKKSK